MGGGALIRAGIGIRLQPHAGLGELRLGLRGGSGDVDAGSAGTGSSSEGVGTGRGGDAAFWGAAGAARAAGLAQGWVAES